MRGEVPTRRRRGSEEREISGIKKAENQEIQLRGECEEESDIEKTRVVIDRSRGSNGTCFIKEHGGQM